MDKYLGYVSEIDRFLIEYDQQHSGFSQTQKNEITKHQRVYRLRDNIDNRHEARLLNDWFEKNE